MNVLGAEFHMAKLISFFKYVITSMVNVRKLSVIIHQRISTKVV